MSYRMSLLPSLPALHWKPAEQVEQAPGDTMTYKFRATQYGSVSPLQYSP